MLKCNGKIFMNLQEAVQWLLNNNALFFMCNEDYAADTEISLSELVNPSPANPKIGSLVLFADGKISPITGLTDDSFVVGDQSTNLKYGREVDEFQIDASQHLIVNYMDGTSQDLGPIFNGNVTIAGDLAVTGAINGESEPSVKPIYCHPVSIQCESGTYNNTKLICLIFDNSATPLTVTTFYNLCASSGLRIMLSGYVCYSGKVYIASFISASPNVLCCAADGDYQSIPLVSILEGARFNDDVNKIN